MIQLRPYQARALDEARAHFAAGRRAVLCCGPTGMGKTVLGAAIARGVIARGRRVAWYAHTRELVTQAANTLRRLGLDVGADGLNPGAPCQVTSVQTALARGALPAAEVVILDEAHHYAASEWRRVPDAYRVAGARFVGLTATPERGDGLGLGAGDAPLFDALVSVCQVRELVDVWRQDPTSGLVPCEVVAPTGRVKKLARDPSEAYAEFCPGASCVVFAPHVRAAEHFAEGFRRRSISVAVIHGAMDQTARDEALAAFGRGEVRVLCNVYVLTEGWDAPIATACILARRCGSASLYYQMVGRVLRPHPGKTSALLVDLVGAVDMHGLPDEDRAYSLDGVGVQAAKKALTGDRVCRVCKAPVGDAEACPTCGMVVSQLEIPAAEQAELERVRREEWAARQSDDKRAATLARWQRECLARGHKLTAADHKFKAVFKRFPDTATRARAAQILAPMREAAAREYDAARLESARPTMARTGGGP